MTGKTRRQVFTWIVVAVALVRSENVQAREFADGALGVGIVGGSHSFSSTTNLGRRVPGAENPSGPLVDLTLMAGEVGRRWGVGIEVDGAFMHTIEGSGVDSGPTNARLLSASAVALWLDKEAGLNAAASLGLCTAEIHGRSEFIGGLPEYTVTDNLDEAMFGPRFALRGGVEWPNRLGIAITWSLSYLVGSDSKYVPMTAAVQGTASWW